MAGKNDASVAAGMEQEQADEMAQFAGFSTVDGEVQKAQEAPAAGKPVAGKAAAAQAAEDDGDEDGGSGNGAAEHGGKPTKSAQARIDKAVGKQRAAERRAEQAEANLAEVNRRLAALEGGGQRQQQQTTTTTAAGAPDPKNYEGGEYDSRYIADVARHSAAAAAREEVQKHNASQKQEAEAKTKAERVAELTEKRTALTTKGTELYEDFEEVVFDDDVMISQTIGELTLDSEHGAAIAYMLASDPVEQKRVFGLSPARQAAWFGVKEAELSSQSQDAGDDDDDGEHGSPSREAPKTVTKAPPAPKHNSRGIGGSPKVSAATSDFAAFERMAQSQK